MSRQRDDRRDFLRRAGGSLVAAGAMAGIGLSPRLAAAAQTCATQSKSTQQATTPQMALQMLKDGILRPNANTWLTSETTKPRAQRLNGTHGEGSESSMSNYCHRAK